MGRIEKVKYAESEMRIHDALEDLCKKLQPSNYGISTSEDGTKTFVSMAGTITGSFSIDSDIPKDLQSKVSLS